MEELKQELYKIVYEYSINNKIADKEFVVDVLDLCIDAFNINDYVKIYEVNNNHNSMITAGYALENKYILFNLRTGLDGIFEKLQEEKEIGLKSTKFLDYFKINSEILYGIIFEITTANQYKSCIKNPNTLESEILSLSLDRNIEVVQNKAISVSKALYFKLLDQHYLKRTYHDACPSIRMANITAATYVRDISKMLDEDLKDNIETYTELNLLNEEIMTYADYAPTTFVRTVNESMKARTGLPHLDYSIEEIENMYKELSIKNNLSYDERIWLGLPITKEEKQKVLEKGINLHNILLKKD